MVKRQDAAVVGVYATKQERQSERTTRSLIREAVFGALDDAGFSIEDVDGWYGPFPFGNDLGMSGGTGFALGNVGYQLDIALSAGGTSQGADALLEAVPAIAWGEVNVAVIVYGQARGPADGRVASWTRPTDEFTEWTGSITAGQIALQARRHMHEYGTTLEQMAYGAATVRNHGHIHPDAVMFGRGPYTADDVLESRKFADPFTLLMSSIVSDGASALVVASAERAAESKHDPVWVIGGASARHFRSYFEVPTLDIYRWRDRLFDGFGRAGVSHNDVDQLQLYDHFSSGLIIETELMGFCEPGEGGPFIVEHMDFDQKFPMVTDGGNLSFSHPGAPHNFKIVEAVRQFRGFVPDLCPDWESGEHTYDRAVCRKLRDPQVAAIGTPPTGGFAYAILAK